MNEDQEIAELKQSLAWAQQQKTLRDEFAMAALSTGIQYPVKDLVRSAYEIADAMMKERHK